MVAHLRMQECTALSSLVIRASGAEQHALVRRSWSALLSVIAILQRRLEDNTLLPGTVRKEELDYSAHVLAATFAAKKVPAPSFLALQALASAIGYDVLISALHRGLNFSFKMFRPLLPAAQRKSVELFVRALFSAPSLLSLTRVRRGHLRLGFRSPGRHPLHRRFP